jgi:nitrate reductase gamma subunit
MGILFSLVAVVALTLIALVGAAIGLGLLFGVIIPYLALAIFIGGFTYRVVRWAQSPAPFKIPTTCGQQKSLPWIRNNELESPSSTWGVIKRMFLEVFLFRTLFRNTKVELRGQRAVYGGAKWLWLAGIAFHYAFLVTILRHIRLFVEPTPYFVDLLNKVDGAFEIGVPHLYISGAVLVVAVGYLLFRRVAIPQMKYISLASDYFPLLLILGIGVSGIVMRHFLKVELPQVKELAVGLFSLHPFVPEGIGVLFYIHLFLVSVLIAYFPFSKLMHMGGVFLSPTRNLANNSRAVRYVNPWNYPVKVHTYEEYEDDFRDRMKQVGIPVEKE